MKNNWNPRFVAYAASQGRTPEAQLEFDKEAWPGGCMAGFMVWISEKIGKFVKAKPEIACCSRCAAHKPEFDQFLNSFSKTS